MERIVQAVGEVPPFTRFYMLAAVTLSTATSIGIISPSSLIYVPNKVFSGQYQVWRVFTSFLYFGDLKFSLLMHLFFIRRSMGELEESFSTKFNHIPSRYKRSEEDTTVVNEFIDRNRSYDFFYYIFLACIGIFIMVTYGYIQRDMKIVQLGPLLDDIMLYILCKRQPTIQFTILFLFDINGALLPYVLSVLNWVASGELRTDVFGSNSGLSDVFGRILRLKVLWQTFVCHTIGQLWWFVNDVIFDTIHSPTTDCVNKLHEKYTKTNTFNYMFSHTFDLLQILCLPPWYWVLFYRLEISRPDPGLNERYPVTYSSVDYSKLFDQDTLNAPTQN